jgi:hypothetical protein
MEDGRRESGKKKAGTEGLGFFRVFDGKPLNF